MESLMIDSGLVGKLIGRKGATIQQLQRDYKVRITIAKKDEPQGKRKVTISGFPNDVKKAILAIQAKMISGGRYHELEDGDIFFEESFEEPEDIYEEPMEEPDDIYEEPEY